MRWALECSGNATAWLCQAILASEGERDQWDHVDSRIHRLDELIELTMLADVDRLARGHGSGRSGDRTHDHADG